MSIVLEALEKAQYAKGGSASGGKEGREITQVRIEGLLQKDKRPQLKSGSKSTRKIFILGAILSIAVINLLFLSWWLNRSDSNNLVNIPTSLSSPIVKNIPSKKTPLFNVTGVVWDQEEPIALVNGKFLKEGDEILGAKIIEIQLNKVTFLRKGKEFTISVE